MSRSQYYQGRIGALLAPFQTASVRKRRRRDRGFGAAHSTAWALLGAVFCAFLWASLLTADPADWPNPNWFPHNDQSGNACGRVGAWLAYTLTLYLGDGVYPGLLFVSLVSALRLARRQIGKPIQRTLGIVLLIAATSAGVQLIFGASSGSEPFGPGGVLGFAAVDLAHEHFSAVGTAMILAYAVLVGLVFAAEGWGRKIPQLVGALRRADSADETVVQSIVEPETEAVASTDDLPVHVLRPSPIPDEGSSLTEALEERVETAETVVGPSERAETRKFGRDDEGQAQLFPAEETSIDEELEASGPAPLDRRSRHPRVAPTRDERVPPPHPIEPQPAPRVQQRNSSDTSEAYPRRMKDWTFPSITLLDDVTEGLPANHETVVRAKAKTLERTLEEFRLSARVVQIDSGPVITMYELDLAAGVKVSQIANLTNDIARALKATTVRVVAPLPGKSTVGIEVPNPHKRTVRLKELLTAAPARTQKMHLPLFLGQDAGGQPMIADLAEMPHLLIAGTTGSGKSVCINSIIGSFMVTQRPDRMKLILIDPKMVELTQFKDLPHLMSPIVTDVRRADTILEWAVSKMEERYALLAETGVRNIADFNQLGEEEVIRRLQPVDDEDRARITTHLPYIVMVIDELADLMMTSARTVEHHLCRLAQKSRAVGIHLIVATQRPEAKVVTGLIKSNLPSRIAFRVASRLDSRIVLDQNGAELLMGKGDLLFSSPAYPKLLRAQGTYVSDQEIHALIADLKSKANPEFHKELLNLAAPNVSTEGERDPLFDDAVRVVVESGRGSVSLIQRRLAVGYSRASRLIDQMADAGIVGGYKGSQAREVQLTLDDFEAIREQERRDEAAADVDDGPPFKPYEIDQETEPAGDDP